MKPNADRFLNTDVVIIGGGPAGLATAIALTDLDINSIVIESSHYLDPRLGEHLTPEGVGILKQLGIWDSQFLEKHRLCYGVRSAWGETQVTYSDYLFHPDGTGVNLSRPTFDRNLATLADGKGVRLLLSSQLKQAQQEQNGWILSLDTPNGLQEVRSRVVVDASGRKALFARSQGRTSVYCDRLVGIAAFLEPLAENHDQEETLWLESGECGWWYFARLQDSRGVFLHITDADQLESGKDAPLQTWSKRLKSTNFFSELAGYYHPVEQVLVRSARSHCLDQATGHHWLAVGDAAMSFDPLSSMGITKALKAGIFSSQVILRVLNGETTVLKDYEAEIQQQFNEYLQIRAQYYQMEQRWPSSLFWQRRH